MSVWVALLLSVAARAASTAPITLDAIRARWSELDARTESLSASFQQSTRMDEGPSQKTEGTFLYKKPGLLRLVHLRPESQIIVSDGTWLWAYRPAAKQAVKSRLNSAPGRVGRLPAGGILEFGRLSNLLSDYSAVLSTVSAPSGDGRRRFVVLLTPKPKERRKSGDFLLELHASDQDFFPAEALLTTSSTVIRTVFKDVRWNIAVKESDFHFSPPPGTDVFEDSP